jgi:hypothetical protein
MWLEGERDGRRRFGPCDFLCFCQNGLVAAMHTIEIANGDHPAAQLRRQARWIGQPDDRVFAHGPIGGSTVF